MCSLHKGGVRRCVGCMKGVFVCQTQLKLS